MSPSCKATSRRLNGTECSSSRWLTCSCWTTVRPLWPIHVEFLPGWKDPPFTLLTAGNVWNVGRLTFDEGNQHYLSVPSSRHRHRHFIVSISRRPCLRFRTNLLLRIDLERPTGLVPFDEVFVVTVTPADRRNVGYCNRWVFRTKFYFIRHKLHSGRVEFVLNR